MRDPIRAWNFSAEYTEGVVTTASEPGVPHRLVLISERRPAHSPQNSDGWPGSHTQTSAIISVFAMFPMIPSSPPGIFSQIQPHPSRSWRLTEAKQGQESCDHSVPFAQTGIPASVLHLKKERGVGGGPGLTQALPLPAVPPGWEGRRTALTLRFSTPPGAQFPPRNPLRKPDARDDNIFPIDPGCVATAPPTPRSVSSYSKSCARHFHFLETV